MASSGPRVRVFVEPQNGATYADQLRVAQAAEDLGFDAFFRSDHFLAISGDGLPGPSDSWITLAGIARETSRIRLGTLLTSATFRLPGLLAVAVAQVDAMSAGRVELGLGAGWYDAEHRAYGVPFPPTAERFDRLEEQLHILVGLWDSPVGGPYAFDGRHYRLEASPALPKPVQTPRPPIIVGGSGVVRTPRLAASFADEFNVPPFRTLADAEAMYPRVRRACEQASRDPKTLRLSVALTVCCGSDDAEVHRRAATIGIDLDTLRDVGVVGLPEQVADKCRAYLALGADTIYFQVLDMADVDHLALIAAEVLPLL